MVKNSTFLSYCLCCRLMKDTGPIFTKYLQKVSAGTQGQPASGTYATSFFSQAWPPPKYCDAMCVS